MVHYSFCPHISPYTLLYSILTKAKVVTFLDFFADIMLLLVLIVIFSTDDYIGDVLSSTVYTENLNQ